MTTPDQDHAGDMVRRYLAAFNRRDVDAIVRLFADDAVLEDPVGSEPLRGREAIRAFYEGFRDARSHLRLAGPVHATGTAIAFSFLALLEEGGDASLVEVTDCWLLDGDGRIRDMKAFFGPGNVHRLSEGRGSGPVQAPLPLLGKVAFVAGGGSGIGQAAAVELARQGARVAVAGRRHSACQETTALIEAIGGEALALSCDATQEAQVEQAIAATLARWGRLDCAVNSAGLTHDPTFLADLSLEQFEATLAANARSVFLGMKHQIRAMLDCGRGGAIVNVTSDAAIGGLPLLSDYSAAKHAATGLTRTAALEYARDGIRINSIAPGPVQTPMLDSMSGTEEALRDMMLIGRIGQPQEVADAILWLCSDRASFVFGQVLQVDGGLGGVSCVAPVEIPKRQSIPGSNER